MRLVRIAICNVNTTVGAVKSNVDRAIALGKAAAADDATVVAYPEQLVSGYPPEDLVQWRSFVAAQWRELSRFAEATTGLAALFVVGVTVERGAGVYNCAALVHRGRVLGLVPKEKLPTYNVFYEGRTFSRGAPGLYDELHGVPFGDIVFDVDFGTLAVEVCEDIWSPDGPMRRRCYAGAELVVNISASPYRLGVVDTRREMISTRAGDNQCVVAYAALVGANDNLVFDGGGYVAQNGRLLLDAPRFVEGFAAVTVDLDRTTRLRREITTWRTDQESFAALAPENRSCQSDGTNRGSIAAEVSGAGASELLFAGAVAAAAAARGVLRRSARRAGHGGRRLLREDRRLQDHRRGAVGRARFAALPDRGASLGGASEEKAARGAARVLHADALLVGGDQGGGGGGGQGHGRAARDRVDRRRVRGAS